LGPNGNSRARKDRKIRKFWLSLGGGAPHFFFRLDFGSERAVKLTGRVRRRRCDFVAAWRQLHPAVDLTLEGDPVGANRAVGVALRAAGLVEGGEHGAELLRQAVTVLERSDAALEHARALTDLGALMRRQGMRGAARDPLRRGLDLANR
jgi:hypothetical protein